MAQSIQASTGNTLYSYEDTINATGGKVQVDGSLPTEFNPMNSKIVWGFSVLLVLVLARVFGGGRKLPPGAKGLPRLPGMY